MITGKPNQRRARSLANLSRDSKQNHLSSPYPPLSISSSEVSSDVSVKSEGISIGSPISSTRDGEEDLLLSSNNGGKHDYDWLLTPPGTPDGNEAKPDLPLLQISRSEADQTSNRTSFMNRSSVSASSSVCSSSSSQSTRNTGSLSPRPSSSLVTYSRSRARSSTPTARPRPSRYATPSKGRLVTTCSSADKNVLSPKSRPSTPSSKPQLRNSNAVATRSSSSPATPSGRNPVPFVTSTSGSTILGGSSVSNGKSVVASSRPRSAGPRTRPLQRPTQRPLSADGSRTAVPKTFKKPTATGSSETTGTVTSQRRNPSPVLTRGRAVAESSGRNRLVGSDVSRKTDSQTALRFSKTGEISLNAAIRNMDIRNGRGRNRSLSSTLFPQSIRSSTSKVKPASLLDGPSSKGSNRRVIEDISRYRNEAEEDIRFARLGVGNDFGSFSYDSLLLTEDAKSMNWLHSIGDKYDQGLVFDSGLEPPPDPFDTLRGSHLP